MSPPRPLPALIARWGHRLNEAVERRWWVVFAVFSAALLLTTVARAKGKPFWHDEIYTIMVSQSPSLDHMRRGLMDGLDLQPPLNTILTRIVHGVAGVGTITTRAVPIAAYWGSSLFVFLILRRRTSLAVAMCAVLFMCFTAAFRYAVEARGYALMLLCFSAALWAWMGAAEGRKRRLHLWVLGTAIAAGMWTHYFSVLVLFPIAVGELVRFSRTRRPDWGIVATVVAAGIASVPIVLLGRVGAGQASTFWSQASFAKVVPTYQFLLNRSIDLSVIQAAVAGIAVGWVAVWIGREEPSHDQRRSVPAAEWAAGLACGLVPIVGVALGVFVTGVFSDHYALSGAIGLALVLPTVIWLAGGRASVALLPLAILFGVRFSESVVMTPVPWHIAVPSPISTRPLLLQSLETASADQPVAVSGGLSFLQFWYYAPPAYRERLTFLASPDRALANGPSDTIDRGLATLARWTPVRVDEYHAFLQRHGEFRVYSAGGGWLLKELAGSGAVLRPGGRELDAQLYVVERGSAR